MASAAPQPPIRPQHVVVHIAALRPDPDAFRAFVEADLAGIEASVAAEIERWRAAAARAYWWPWSETW